MINSQTPSNDDPHSSSETNNDSLNDNFDNQKDESLSNNDNHKETMNSIRDGKVPKPDDERKLFVGQLSSDITKEDLEKYFAKFGSIEDVTIKYDVPGGRARGFAFILFDDKESIQKVLHVQSHTINQCQIDPKPAHRRPPVTNPVKKIFLGQLPVDFVEQDLSDYFSQFGIIDTIELPMDREKSVRRPFGFVSFSSEKSAEEVLRQQRHSVNGASIEVRPAKPRPHEQQQLQMQQQYQYGEYFSPNHFNNIFISPISNATMAHPSMMNTSMNPNVYYTPNNTNNYSVSIDQWSQGTNNGGTFWNSNNGDSRNNHNNSSTSASQWSTGNSGGGLSSTNSNNNVYGILGNSGSTSSSVYSQNQGQPIYNSNGMNQQNPYAQSNYPNQIQSSYTLPSSQSTGNIYPSGYSSTVPPNDVQSPSASWNQYLPANGSNQINYDPNVYYTSYYPNVFAQQYYQQQIPNQSQAQMPIEQTVSPNGFPTSSNGGLDKSYQHLSR